MINKGNQNMLPSGKKQPFLGNENNASESFYTYFCIASAFFFFYSFIPVLDSDNFRDGRECTGDVRSCCGSGP